MSRARRPAVLVAAVIVAVLVAAAAALALVERGDDATADRRASSTPASAATAPGTPAAPATTVATTADGLPEPDGRIPTGPRTLARHLTAVSADLRRAIDRWRREGDPSHEQAPRDVELLALRVQRIVLHLAPRPRTTAVVLSHLRGAVRSDLRAETAALGDLRRIKSVVKQRPKVRLGPPRPADELRTYYRAAWRRFGVGWPLLAAVNHVETQFGRFRNESVSGASGPMQFIPPTWRAYGMGGDVNDPRDAIMGAANYLRANGAPRDEARALFRYNPSDRYVRAVAALAARIRADERFFYALHARQVFLPGPDGLERRTGPDRSPTPTRPSRSRSAEQFQQT